MPNDALGAHWVFCCGIEALCYQNISDGIGVFISPSLNILIEFRKINGTLLQSSKCSINVQKFNELCLRRFIE